MGNLGITFVPLAVGFKVAWVFNLIPSVNQGNLEASVFDWVQIKNCLTLEHHVSGSLCNQGVDMVVVVEVLCEGRESVYEL